MLSYEKGFVLLYLLLTAKNTYGQDSAATTIQAHFINVGQADATLLEFPCGAILIDAGAQDTTT